MNPFSVPVSAMTSPAAHDESGVSKRPNSGPSVAPVSPETGARSAANADGPARIVPATGATAATRSVKVSAQARQVTSPAGRRPFAR